LIQVILILEFLRFILWDIKCSLFDHQVGVFYHYYFLRGKCKRLI